MFDEWVIYIGGPRSCVWRGGVAEAKVRGCGATVQLEEGCDATLKLAEHAGQRARGLAAPERRESGRHIDLSLHVVVHMLREVDVCVCPEPQHGPTVGGPSGQKWTVYVL